MILDKFMILDSDKSTGCTLYLKCFISFNSSHKFPSYFKPSEIEMYATLICKFNVVYPFMLLSVITCY